MTAMIKKSQKDIETFFDTSYMKEDDFKIGRFIEGNDSAKENLIIMESHTDPWIDTYIEQQVDCEINYFHKRTMYFTLLGNFDTIRNKKDMSYDSNTCNHMWCHGKTKTELESIIKNIVGKTVYAVWDFDYLLKVCIEKRGKYYTKFVTFDNEKDAKAYLKQKLQEVKQENEDQKFWDTIKRGFASDLFVAKHKPFKQVHQIQVPQNINVFGIEEFIDTTKDFFEPIFKDAYISKANNSYKKFFEDKEFLKDSDTGLQEYCFNIEVTNSNYGAVMVRGKKKLFQNNIDKFKTHLGVA